MQADQGRPRRRSRAVDITAVSSWQATITSPRRGSTPGDTAPNHPRPIASSRVSTVARSPSTSRQVATTSGTAPRGAVEVPEPGLAAEQRDAVAQPVDLVDVDPGLTGAVDHAVVGDHQQPGRGRQRLAQLLGLGVDHRAAAGATGSRRRRTCARSSRGRSRRRRSATAASAEAATVAAIRSPTRSAPTYVAPRCDATVSPDPSKSRLLTDGDVDAGVRQPPERGRVRLPLDAGRRPCPTRGG